MINDDDSISNIHYCDVMGAMLIMHMIYDQCIRSSTQKKK